MINDFLTHPSVAIFGLCYQALGLGLCAPLYLLAHILTSPTASHPTAERISISKPVLLAILPAIVVGFVLPTVSMSLPTPSYLLYGTKANLVLLWQFFPLWTSLLCLIFSYAFHGLTISIQPSSILKATYSIVIALASAAHISALTLSVMPILAPSIFNPTFAKELTGAYLKFPPWPIQSNAKASSMAEGALWFIQYDYILTSWAFLFWSVSLRLASLTTAEDPKGSQVTYICVSALGRALFLGPLGSAASLIWERDDAIMAGDGATIDVKKLQ